jgi:ribosomal protein L37E
MKYAKVTEVDTTGKEIYCRKCGKPHFLLKYDGQVMQIGNVQIFNSIRYSCICGFPQTFYPLPLEDDTKSLGESSRKVLIKLGKKSKGDNKQDEF